jgi:hypothetical protein
MRTKTSLMLSKLKEVTEKLLESEIAKQRIGVQKSVADDKLDIATQRLEQQAELKLLELQAKFGGIR